MRSSYSVSRGLSRRILTALPVVALLSLSTTAAADEKEADTCLRTKIWAGYDDGWAVRTATTTTLGAGEHRIYLVTLYAGNQYEIKVCGDKSSTDLDLVLHDADGKELSRDKSDDREPMLKFTPQTTETYYVAVYAATLAADAKSTGVALAVTYK
jgi:hypothetical protein